MHPVLLELPLPDQQLDMWPALVAVSVLGFALAVYGHVLRRTGLRTFGVALGVVAGVAGWSFRAETISLGGFAIPAYGTALGLAVIAGWWLTARLARGDSGLDHAVRDAFIVCAVCGLLAGRASFVLISGDRLPELELLALRQGGLLGMGALAGGLLGSYAFLRHLRLDFWAWLDAVAPAGVLAAVLLRVGCYLHGCDYGVEQSGAANGWLAALGRFARWQSPDTGPVEGPPVWIDQVVAGALSPDQRYAHTVHPVQLYEAAGALLLLPLVLWMRRRNFEKGQTGLAALLGYLFLRFVIETWRGDVGRGLIGPYLNPAVLLGVGLMLFAVAFAYGPALSIPPGRRRVVALLASAFPALLSVSLLARDATPIRPSVSQWLALALAGWAAHAWTLTSRPSPSRPPGG